MTDKLELVFGFLTTLSDPRRFAELSPDQQSLLKPVLDKFGTDEQVAKLKLEDLSSEPFQQLFKSSEFPRITAKIYKIDEKADGELGMRQSMDLLAEEYSKPVVATNGKTETQPKLSNAEFLTKLKEQNEKLNNGNKKHRMKDDGTKDDPLAFEEIRNLLKSAGIASTKVDEKLAHGGEVAYVTWNGYSKFKKTLEQIEKNGGEIDENAKKALIRAEEAIFQPGYDPKGKPVSPVGVERQPAVAATGAERN